VVHPLAVQINGNIRSKQIPGLNPRQALRTPRRTRLTGATARAKRTPPPHARPRRSSNSPENSPPRPHPTRSNNTAHRPGTAATSAYDHPTLPTRPTSSPTSPQNEPTPARTARNPPRPRPPTPLKDNDARTTYRRILTRENSIKSDNPTQHTSPTLPTDLTTTRKDGRRTAPNYCDTPATHIDHTEQPASVAINTARHDGRRAGLIQRSPRPPGQAP